MSFFKTQNLNEQDYETDEEDENEENNENSNESINKNHNLNNNDENNYNLININNNINNINNTLENENGKKQNDKNLSYNSDIILNNIIKEEENNENNINESSNNNNENITNSDNIDYAIEDNEDVSQFDSIENLAIKYPFELDEFQKRSIIRLEQNQNVLVCAHTSSGKTVVAEYGIALGRKHSKRVVYTSPIKALSNQKYRDFKKIFDDVGILTGDVNINPDAQCLIMTTEILQNCLYKKSQLLSQLEWIIFDEIHYINDNERGHVWEEILILLPPGINLIMLSATIPNYMEFAKWVGSIKKTTVYVEITLKRVVPLKHQIYIDSQNVYEVKSIDGEVFDYNIRKALEHLKEINEGKYKKNYGTRKADEQQMKNSIKYFMDKKEKYYKKKFVNKFKKGKFDQNEIRITKMHHKLTEMVEYLQKKNLCPAVIFVFSIRRITEYTRMLSSKNLLNEQEKNKIIKFYNEVISSKISKEDQEIPQIKEMFEILQSGIGLHHAGLLPILKEIIEVLYSQGLIKVLFATTSFSIGLNMPTRTVVFTDLYKFNDGQREILSSSEYLQMCGRAGRRGIDSIGNVYLILTDQISKNENEEIFQMLKGEGTDVKSKLRLSYKTFLSFSSIDQKNMQIFVQDSFLESIKTLSIPEKIREMKDMENNLTKLKFSCKYDKDTIIKNIESIYFNTIRTFTIDNIKKKEENKFDIEDFPCKDYYLLNQKYKYCNKKFFSSEEIGGSLIKNGHGKIMKVKDKNNFYPKINQGNYVMLIHPYSPNSETPYRGKFWCLGIKDRTKDKSKKYVEYDDDDFIGGGDEESNRAKEYDKNILKNENEYKGYNYYYDFYSPEDIINIYDFPYIKGIKNMKDNIIKFDGRYYYNHKKDFEKKILKELYEIKKEFFEEKMSKANKLDYDYSKYITNYKNKNNLIERKALKEDSKKCLCYNCPLFNDHIPKFYKYKFLQKKIEEIKKDLSPENMAYLKEFNNRKKILKEMKYINDNNLLTLKGKAAREINTTDCLLISEILLSDIFSKLTDEEIVGFLSGFATNKNQIELTFPKITDNLNEAYEKFLEIYEKIKKEEEKNEFEENKYNRRFMPDVALAIKSWMEEKPFGEICKLTDLEEGKLYTLILRIFLFLDEIYNFYTVLGNVKNSERFDKIKNSMLRGIMGVQSLYLQDKISFDLNK